MTLDQIANFAGISREFTGNFCIDDTFLYENGEKDFDKYSMQPGHRKKLSLAATGSV